MPVQTVAIGLPWEQLATAHDRLAEAERFGDADDVASARDAVAFHRERCGLLGTLLVNAALDVGTMELQRKLSEVFGGLGVAAFEEARRSKERTDWALRKLDAAEQRIRELERCVASLTFGVGEPARI